MTSTSPDGLREEDVTRSRRRRSLALRTAAGVVALLAVVLGVIAATSLVLTGRTVDSQLHQSADQAWTRSYSYLWRGPRTEPDLAGRSPLNAPGQPDGMIVLVTSGDTVTQASRLDESSEDEVIDLGRADVEELAAFAEEVRAAQEEQDARLEAMVNPPDEDDVFDVSTYRTMDLQRGRYLVRGEVIDDDNNLAVVGLPMAEVDAMKTRLLQVQVLGSVAALVLAGLLSWWWIRRSLRPLGEVSQAAARVADVPMGSGEVSLQPYRVRPELARQGDEVGDVGFALNRLIGSVDGAMEERNRSEQRLRAFVADASHELRTPLAAVRGYAEMINLTEHLTRNGQAALSRVLHQSDRMGSLVEDLLLLARLDSGRDPRRGELDLGELVIDSVMDATAAGRDHHWSVDVPEEPVTVLGDRQQLAQLVANLLSNARKHTPEGTSVVVRLAQEPGEGTVRLTVEDDGPGIEAELGSGLFDRFVRGDSARTAREGSTGLGLAIVRSVARAHGGEATAESMPGRTVFTVELPATGSAGPGGSE